MKLSSFSKTEIVFATRLFTIIEKGNNTLNTEAMLLLDIQLITNFVSEMFNNKVDVIMGLPNVLQASIANP